MKKYVVAYLNYHDNELGQVVIHSTSEAQAMLDYLAKHQDINFDETDLLDLETVEQITEWCSNCDSNISVIEI